MELNVLSQTENKTLSRIEAKVKVVFEKATHSRKDIQKEIAKKLKTKEELTIIQTIDTSFSEAKAVVEVTAYSDDKVMANIERKNLVEKHSGHEPKKEETEE